MDLEVLVSTVLHLDLWFRSKEWSESQKLCLVKKTHIEKLLMDNVFSVHSSDWFYCPCLLWKGHIMDSSWTLFLHSTLQCFYAAYSYILASAETPVSKYKDWVTLSAGSGYMIFSSQASTALTAQSTPTPHKKNTYTLPPPFPHVQMWSSTRVVNYCQHGPTFCFAQQAAIRACSDSSAFDIYISTEF